MEEYSPDRHWFRWEQSRTVTDGQTHVGPCLVLGEASYIRVTAAQNTSSGIHLGVSSQYVASFDTIKYEYSLTIVKEGPDMISVSWVDGAQGLEGASQLSPSGAPEDARVCLITYWVRFCLEARSTGESTWELNGLAEVAGREENFRIAGSS